MKIMSKGRWFAVIAVLFLWGCSQGDELLQRDLDSERSVDHHLIKQGLELYSRHCRQCHGDAAQGDEAWRRPDSEGKYPPPPLNGTGHAWHHSKPWLRHMIREGSQPQGNMPAWADRLNEDEIEAIIAWFQSLWPDRVYQAWVDMQ